jgi:hypothetical protein
VGKVKDFYFKPGTNSVDAFLVDTGLLGYRALPITAIKDVGRESITMVNAEGLISQLPPFPLGQSLLSSKVVSESGKEVGRIGSLSLAVDPPEALRIAGFELAPDVSKRTKSPRRFDANDVLDYMKNSIIISDQDARRLR